MAARAAADFAAARAGAVEQFEPVRFDLEKGLVTRQFLGGQAARRQRQPRRGARLDFCQQILHAPISWVQNPLNASARPQSKPCDESVFA